MTVNSVISLPKIPYLHRIYMVLANLIDMWCLPCVLDCLNVVVSNTLGSADEHTPHTPRRGPLNLDAYAIFMCMQLGCERDCCKRDGCKCDGCERDGCERYGCERDGCVWSEPLVSMTNGRWFSDRSHCTHFSGMCPSLRLYVWRIFTRFSCKCI